MSIVAWGMSHQTAPIETRERCAFALRELVPTVREILDAASAREGVLLSTCNRTEFYVVEGTTDTVPALVSTVSARLGADAGPYVYVRRDREAVRHLMRVAAGLDSMVLGEAQIQGQVRDAWEYSRTNSGPVLNRLFQSALAVAGRVRTETGIGRGAASISSAAVQLAKKIFGSLQGRRAMVLGAGEMAELALQCLLDEGVRATLVANRTYEHAEQLARRHGAVAMRYEECWPALGGVDLLICSTSAPHAVVTQADVASALSRRGDRPLCILDIALPRDVEASVGKLENVFLYDLDDLRAVVAANLEGRRADLPTAEQLVDREVERFWQWLAGLAAVPVVTHFRTAMDRIRADELAHAASRFGSLSPTQREALEHFSRSLMNKFLHEPSVRLRAAAANGRGLGIVDAARYLFALDDTLPPGPSAMPAAGDELPAPDVPEPTKSETALHISDDGVRPTDAARESPKPEPT